MAKKLKKDDAAKGEISAEELSRVVKEHSRQVAHAAEYNGLAGQAIKTAIDRYNLDRKAFRFILGLSRMEETKRQATLRGLLDYAHKLEMFASVDAFDDVIDTMEAIVSEVRSNGSTPRAADPVVSTLVN